jgi:hypothetical protein
MANSYGVTAAQLRARCNNVSIVTWPDASLVTLSEQVEADAHQRLGKTSAYSITADNQKYLIMQQILKEGVAAEVLSGLDLYVENAKQALINYYTKIKNLKQTKMTITTGGPNITDELNSLNYIPEASDTY